MNNFLIIKMLGIKQQQDSPGSDFINKFININQTRLEVSKDCLPNDDYAKAIW